MTPLLQDFLRVYDSGHDLSFDGIKFRPGAPVSLSPDGTPAGFGLCEGFRQLEGGLTWGFVRFHMGCDRAGTPPPVYAPFTADRVRAHDDGGLVYGWLVRLLHEGWGFETRIAHMDHRTDASPALLDAVARGGSLASGVLLGDAGRYGLGSGDHPEHTHAEIVSIDRTCALLDELAVARWGDAALRPYEDGEIVEAYRQRHMYKWVTRQVIDDAWAEERKAKGILWANRYKAVFAGDRYSGHAVTRYSSALVFAGM